MYRSLHFKGDPEQTNDASLEELCQMLKSSKTIQEIRLDFEKCTKISDKGYKMIRDSLKGHRLLKKVRLCIITSMALDDTWKELVAGLGRFSLMRDVGINLGGNCRTRDKGVTAIGRALKRLAGLEKIRVDFCRLRRDE